MNIRLGRGCTLATEFRLKASVEIGIEVGVEAGVETSLVSNLKLASIDVSDVSTKPNLDVNHIDNLNC